jgi:hypothetical protein
MKTDSIEIELDPDKREQLTRTTLDKMLRDIKSLLIKNKKLKIVISPE